MTDPVEHKTYRFPKEWGSAQRASAFISGSSPLKATSVRHWGCCLVKELRRCGVRILPGAEDLVDIAELAHVIIQGGIDLCDLAFLPDHSSAADPKCPWILRDPKALYMGYRFPVAWTIKQRAQALVNAINAANSIPPEPEIFKQVLRGELKNHPSIGEEFEKMTMIEELRIPLCQMFIDKVVEATVESELRSKQEPGEDLPSSPSTVH